MIFIYSTYHSPVASRITAGLVFTRVNFGKLFKNYCWLGLNESECWYTLFKKYCWLGLHESEFWYTLSSRITADLVFTRVNFGTLSSRNAVSLVFMRVNVGTLSTRLTVGLVFTRVNFKTITNNNDIVRSLQNSLYLKTLQYIQKWSWLCKPCAQ